MTSDLFVYWLHSTFELAHPNTDPRKVGFTPAQATIIADHLQLVLTKATPERATPPTRAPRPTVFPEPTYCTGAGDVSLDGSTLLC